MEGWRCVFVILVRRSVQQVCGKVRKKIEVI